MKNDVLKQAIELGIINEADVQQKMEVYERNKLLEQHPFKIWCGSDGKWRTYLPDKIKGRKLLKKSTEESVKSAVVAYWREENNNPTVEEVFNEWNDRRLKLKKISDSTHDRYKQCFARHYKTFGKRKIKSLEWEDVEEFLEEQISEFELTAKAFYSLKGLTKSFLQRAKKRGLIDFNVVTLMQEMDVSERSFKKVIKEDNEEVYDEEELSAILEYLEENFDLRNAGILLMFVTGIRVGELAALKRSDFDGNTLKIRRTETRVRNRDENGTGYRYLVKEFPKSEAGFRTIVIPESYTWVIEKILGFNQSEEYVFLNEKKERMTTNCFRKRLERVNEKVKAVQKSPHKIRKTYGTILLDNNIDKKLVTDQMGHTTVSCTERHYHRNRKSINVKAKMINNIPEFAFH